MNCKNKRVLILQWSPVIANSVYYCFTIPNLYSTHYQTLKVLTGYINNLDILMHFPDIGHTVDSRQYDICYNEILLITIPNLHPNHFQTIENQTGYIDSLVILIQFPYPISIVITKSLTAYEGSSLFKFFRVYIV
jgi:hypothetical protein